MLELKSIHHIREEENITIKKKIRSGHSQEHSHEFIEIVYIWKGEGHQVINGRKYSIQHGDIIFLNIGDVHTVYSEQELGVVNIILNHSFLSQELSSSHEAIDILSLTSFKDFQGAVEGIAPLVSFSGYSLMKAEGIIEAMLGEFNTKATGYRSNLKSYLQILIVMILRQLQLQQPILRSGIHSVIPLIVSYIHENYQNKISLEDLARMSFYNPSYFSKVFRECFGKTLTEYIQEIRIREAMHLLENTNMTVEEVAAYVGYRDRKQFYFFFKQLTGRTPGSYKNKN